MPGKGEYTSLSLKATRDDAEGVYVFTTELDGATFLIQAHNIGDVDEKIDRATAAAEAERAAREASRQAEQAAQGASSSGATLEGDPGAGGTAGDAPEPPPAT